MWIRKEEYEKLKEENNTLQRRLSECVSCSYKRYCNSYIEDIKILAEEIEKLQTKIEELKKYKQMYADEVQKRLELIKLYEVQEM